MNDNIDEVVNTKKTSSNIGLLDLPYPVLCQIFSYLCVEDATSLSKTCSQAQEVANDQHTWRLRLWHWAKAVNVCMVENVTIKVKEASGIISDPLLLNLETLYSVLSPCQQRVAGSSRVDVGNMLSKLDPAHANGSYQFLTYVLNALSKIFGQKVARTDQCPLQIGVGEDRYLLFSSAETRSMRSLILSLIASRNNLLETVGLVEGRPGGIGSGVTVKYDPVVHDTAKGKSIEPHLMNLLPLRRVYPRLLTSTSQEDNQCFIEEVADLLRGVEGIIFVLDAECRCHLPPELQTNPVTCNYSNASNMCLPGPPTIVDGHSLHLTELKAMLRTIPSNRCPVFLILLALYNPPAVPREDGFSEMVPGDDTSPAPASDATETGCKLAKKLHKPYLLKDVMDSLRIPWAAFEVEVSTLNGLSLALNWLVRRTAVHRSSSAAAL